MYLNLYKVFLKKTSSYETNNKNEHLAELQNNPEAKILIVSTIKDKSANCPNIFYNFFIHKMNVMYARTPQLELTMRP